MRTTASFSALPRPAQWLATRQLRRDIVCRLGESTASLAWWRQALLEVNPLLEWTNDQHVIVVRRGRAMLDRMARCYLLSPTPGSALAAPLDPIDEELLALLP